MTFQFQDGNIPTVQIKFFFCEDMMSLHQLLSNLSYYVQTVIFLKEKLQ